MIKSIPYKRILVCGSQWWARIPYENLGYDEATKEKIKNINFEQLKMFYDVMNFFYHDPDFNIKCIIEGDAKGADRLAGKWADLKGIGKAVYPADWDKYGKKAGPIRNKQMLDEGKPDCVIAFLTKNSRGTRNMVSQADKAGVKVFKVEWYGD